MRALGDSEVQRTFWQSRRRCRRYDEVAKSCSERILNLSNVGMCTAGSRANIPLLASPQGGEGCVMKKMPRSDRIRRSGEVFLLDSLGKPPRPRCQWMLRDVLLIARATPPCGDARRGILVRSQISSHP